MPLKTIISASNETPPKNQGLEALYDRFLLRVNVPPIVRRENFENLIDYPYVENEIGVKDDLKISNDEIKTWKEEIRKVKLSKEIKDIIYSLRSQFFAEETQKELDVYVSDRRWAKVSNLLKASAFFCGREETNLSDALILKYCLWSTEENREKINSMIEKAIKDNAYKFENFNLLAFDKEKDALDKEIKQELYYTEDIFETMRINGNEYYECQREDPYYSDVYTFFIDYSKKQSDEIFSPIDKHGTEFKFIKCNF